MNLRVQSVSKRYGHVQALFAVSADFRPGEIHAVLGENGAGKSTLMGVLAGFVVPDSGSVTADSQDLPLGDPVAVKNLGIEMVHQHFMLVPAFSVGENLRLASLRSSDSDPEKAVQLAEELGWKIEADAKTGSLPVGVQQRIEILKALAADAKVLILDEPTAVLSPDEVQDLFRVLRDLKGKGKTIILIAHKLSEIMQVADRVTVLRRGKLIASSLLTEVDERQIAEWMVGEMPAATSPADHSIGQVVLEARDLRIIGDRGEEAVRGASFSIRAGEILGFGGVDGNGQVELAEALAGVRRVQRGALLTRDKPIDWSGLKVAYIPQDRQVDGLALNMSVLDNMLVTGIERAELMKGPFLQLSKSRRWGQALVDRFSIKAHSLADPAGSLSGGNQQKVVVARSLDERPDLLVAVNPTRGLDIRATQFVQEQILKAAAEGAAVALFSTDLDELAALAHRTLFMSRGELREGGAEALVG